MKAFKQIAEMPGTSLDEVRVMSESNVVFCVEWGHAQPPEFKSPEVVRKVFDDVSNAKAYYDMIDLHELFANHVRNSADGCYHVFKKICYIAELDETWFFHTTAFLARDYYDYEAYAMDDLKRSELRW